MNMLRKIVKDVVTGYTGVAVARIEYATGCFQYQIQPQTLNEKGEPLEGKWFDVSRVELVEDKEVFTVKANTTADDPGGPPPTTTPDFGK